MKYLKAYYSNIELAIILHQCKSFEEIKEVGKAVINLHQDFEIIDVRSFELLAHKRIKSVVS